MVVMAGLTDTGAFLVGLAVAWGLLGIAYALPRVLRSAHRWTSTVLFPALGGWRRHMATFTAGFAGCWLLVLVGAIYSPIAALAPETLPFPGGVRRAFVAINFWLLVAVLPAAFGVMESLIARGRLLDYLKGPPLGFLHVAAVAVALVILLPWVVARRIWLIIRRLNQETTSVDIELSHYLAVLKTLTERFNASGLPGTTAPSSLFVRLPRSLVDRYGPRALRSLAPYDVASIRGPGFELTVYANLLDLVARKEVLGRARSALLGSLPPAGFWWTRSHEGRQLERLILRREPAPAPPADIAQQLAHAELGAQEWRALNREYLLSMTQPEIP